MAGKRCATSELNHDNWDREEVPEEAGTFQKASDDSLKQRVIKTARRRNPISSVRVNDDNEKKSAFTSFTGFGKSSTPTSADFSFLSKINTPNTPPKQNGIEEKVENDKNDISSLKFNNNHSMDKSNDYFSKLKGLNQSVSNWIKKHVDTNPLINLQPIFRDYEKYFEELEKEKILKPPDVNNADSIVFKPTTSVPDSTTEKKQSDTAVTTKVSKESSSITSKPPSTAGSFSFDVSNKETTQATSTTTPSFSFGSLPSNSSISQFSTSSPFTFGNVVKPVTSGGDNKEEVGGGEEEESETPPSNEFTPVVEKDHVYTVRCKVFVKKDDKFGDRGVGSLYLKPIADTEKIQLVVRADTNLGNVLLNFILSENIPMKRLGKKDVMLVCVPTPEVKPPPVPVLIRVKSSEEADKLLETLEKYKK
ncbi:nuclear pore complex protein Nup50 isoform X2 [Diorhabda carinulata]|uniref:nuclear pore complex protein Nup50 isoform X2 n=1 Tax=Diorhabda carinulata TaxID=1163345 RepID=UPI0025A25CE7|nr:nuclear pore complex protein Nup50 isoform X2 [Diorhabda carinulata]